MAPLESISVPSAREHRASFHDGALAATANWPAIQGDDEKLVQRTLVALRRGPIRHHRDQVIVCEGDPAHYIFLVIEGIVRSCRTFQNGTRNILGFYLPGEVFGW
ncbi:MAG: cyclic nucleotide-binding domain-containing protein, partial [Pseudolabrys sp.]